MIVVSGLPRSGTSMMMQMLQAGGVPVIADDARPADADNPRGYFEDARVRTLRRDAAWLRQAGGHAVKIVSALLEALPAGPRWDVLFLTRPIAAVLASQGVMLERRGERDGVSDADMAGHFASHVARVRAAMTARDDVRWLDVPYDDVLTDPNGWANRVATWLGPGLDVSAMAKAVEPSLRRHSR